MKRRTFLASMSSGALAPVTALARRDEKDVWTLFEKGSPSTRALAYSPDGRLIATATGGVIRIWDAQSGALLMGMVFNEDGKVEALTFHPDGKRLLGGGPSEGNLRLWDVETGEELRRYEGLGIGPLSLAYSADASRIVAGGHDNTIRVWDAETGEQVMARGSKGPMFFAAFVGDPSRVIGAGLDPAVRIFDVGTGEPVQTFETTGAHHRCGAVSPDGRLLALGGSKGSAYLYDLERGTLLQTLVTGGRMVRQLAFTPDGRRLLTGASEGDRGAVELWDVTSGQRLWAEIQKISFGMGGVVTLAMNPAGDSFAVSIFPEGVQIWPMPEGAQ